MSLFEEKDMQISLLKGQVNMLAGENKQLKQDLSSHVVWLDLDKRTKKELGDRLAAAEFRTVRTKDELNVAVNDLGRAQSMVEMLNKERAAEAEQFKQAKQEDTLVIKNLRNEVMYLNEISAELGNSVKALNSKIDELRASKEQIVDGAKQRQNQLQSEVRHWQEKAAELESVNKGHVESVNALHSKILDHEGTIHVLSSRNVELNKENEDLRRVVQRAEDEIVNLKGVIWCPETEKVKQLEQRLEIERKAFRHLQGVYGSLQVDFERMKKERDALQDKLESTEGCFDAASRYNDWLRAAVGRYEKNRQELKAEVAKYKNKHKKATAKIAEMKKREFYDTQLGEPWVPPTIDPVESAKDEFVAKQIQAYKDQLMLCGGEIAEKNKLIKVLREKAEMLERGLNQAQVRAEDRIAHFKRRWLNRCDAVSSQRRDLAEANKTCDELREKLASAKKGIESNHQTIESLREEIETCDNALHRTIGERNRHVRVCDKLSRELDDCQKEMTNLKHHLADAKATIRDKDKVLDALACERDGARTMAENYKNKLEKAVKHMEHFVQVDGKWSSCNEVRKDLNSKIVALEKQLRDAMENTNYYRKFYDTYGPF